MTKEYLIAWKRKVDGCEEAVFLANSLTEETWLANPEAHKFGRMLAWRDTFDITWAEARRVAKHLLKIGANPDDPGTVYVIEEIVLLFGGPAHRVVAAIEVDEEAAAPPEDTDEPVDAMDADISAHPFSGRGMSAGDY